MIQHPVGIILILIAIEAAVLFLSSRLKFSKYFSIIPSVFWIYFLPMLASTFGFIDPKAAIYSQISATLLPMALFLLLITVDIKAIVRLGPLALGMFLMGSLGIALGMVIVFVLFKDLIGTQFWSGFAALSASWTGGSANMIAVKEALSVPDEVYLPMVIVDTIVPYVWMGIMVASVGFTRIFDQWNKSNRQILDDLADKVQSTPSTSVKWKPLNVLLILGSAVLAAIGAQYLGKVLPEVKGVITATAWTVLIISSIAMVLSFTPLRQVERWGSNQLGYFILYFVLTTIGAKASLGHLNTSLILIGAGFLVVIIHALVLLISARILRAPLFLVAVASQANVGGVASAPLVAEIYQKGLASVGLLLAILGNIEGSYIGILVGQICRALSG